MLPDLYQAVLYYVLWVTCDVTLGGLCKVLGDAVVKLYEVPPCLRRSACPPYKYFGRRGFAQAGAKLFQHTQTAF
jgi:hypothetical protein